MICRYCRAEIGITPGGKLWRNRKTMTRICSGPTPRGYHAPMEVEQMILEIAAYL